MRKIPQANNLILTREAAKILGCSTGHVRSLARSGRLTAFKLGVRTTALSLTEVVAYGKEKAAGRRRGVTPGAKPGGFSPDKRKD